MIFKPLFFKSSIPLAIFLWTATASAADAPIADESKFVRKPNTVTATQSGSHPADLCFGKPPPSPELEALKLSASLTKDGVRCVTGDFDGNGFLDFVLYEPPDSSGNHYNTGHAVLFDGPHISRVTTLKNPPTQPWPAGSAGPCAGDVKHRDGLMQPATGEPGRTMLYNLSNGKWEENTCGDEAKAEE